MINSIEQIESLLKKKVITRGDMLEAFEYFSVIFKDYTEYNHILVDKLLLQYIHDFELTELFDKIINDMHRKELR